MTSHAASEEITRAETAGSWKLWFGVLGGPLIWITYLVVGYSTEEWFACSPSATDVGQLLGLSVHQFIIVITVITLAVTIASGLVAYSCLKRIPKTGSDEIVRARWMATVGVMNAVLYLLLTVGGAAVLLLNVCETSP